MKNKSKKIINLNIFSIQVIYICIVVLFGIYLSIIKPSTAYVNILVIFLMAGLSIFVYYKEIQNEKYRISELEKSMNNVLNDNLNLLDIPMVALSNATDIIWQNNACKHLIPEEYIIDISIKLEKNKHNSEKLTTQFNFGDNNIYTAIGNEVKFSDTSCMLISFIDTSKEYELTKLLDDKQLSVGILFIDNYDETLQGLDEISKFDIASKIDKTIRQWGQDNKGIVSKVDKDKYLLFIQKQYVKQMEDNSFNILEKIRNLTNETKLPLTVSIGMSYADTTLDEKYTESNSALDIALGRGGDQVVIKNDKKFNFYGGSNLGFEKTSKVRARTISQALRDIIEKSDYVYVIGHKNSDIDCIGSAIGIAKIAKVLNKPVTIIVDDKYNNSTRLMIDKLKSQKDYENVFLNKDDIKKLNTENALLVVVDTHKKTYLAANDVLDKFEKVVVIDHHRRGTEFIDNAIITYHELYSSSASELVSELLMYMDDVVLTPVEAEALYAGILVDTKNFTFKTGVRTFEVAAYLKKSGLDITDVKQLFKNDLETYIVKVGIVKNAVITEDKIAISSTEEQHEDMPIIAAQAADDLLNISGVLASFVLCKVDNVIMISGRSMGDINVQEILENIGGGGHLSFAGAQIAGITITEAKKILNDSIKKYFGNVDEKELNK